jgi:predicted membrane protein
MNIQFIIIIFLIALFLLYRNNTLIFLIVLFLVGFLLGYRNKTSMKIDTSIIHPASIAKL